MHLSVTFIRALPVLPYVCSSFRPTLHVIPFSSSPGRSSWSPSSSTLYTDTLFRHNSVWRSFRDLQYLKGEAREHFFFTENVVETRPTFSARKCSFVLRLQFYASEIMALQRSLHRTWPLALRLAPWKIGFESTLNTADDPGDSGFKYWSIGSVYWLEAFRLFFIPSTQIQEWYSSIFMVVPCINDIKCFIAQLMSSNI